MINIEQMVGFYRDLGYSDRSANARACQDIILKAISQSSMGRKVTIKGGVVMRSISGDRRRATDDLDLDFLRYSIDDDSIRRFISKLNCLEGITIEIKDDAIEPLSQQEYNGKRVWIIIRDNAGNSTESKIDLGVHAKISIEQNDYCFDVCMDEEGASLLINSCEQIFAEKLRSLLRFGPLSSRYKDIFDFCYLKDHVDKSLLLRHIKTYIIDEPSMREKDMDGIRKRVATTFNNRSYKNKVETCGDRNWLQMDVDDAFKTIQDFLESLDYIDPTLV